MRASGKKICRLYRRGAGPARRWSQRAAFFITLTALLLTHATARAATRRLVVLKFDGLPADMVDRFVRERDPRTGKSRLPWIEYLFYQRGTRIANFYVRGMSLSGPSWSLLDTGQHLQIKGNVEYDRLTLHAYDYLNFIPFYINYALDMRRVDMPGPETLDEIGIPLLIDAFPFEERYQSFQLYQRALRWTTLQRSLQNSFLGRSAREVIDEWTTGYETRNIVLNQLERELIDNLNNPRMRYLDYYTTEFDHAAHHNRDRETHLRALQEIDATVGHIWTAIERSPLASETALALVSDHGSNSDERVYSQGYNLVKLLGSAAGGGHHVITKRRLLLDYSIKGVYPLVPLITTTTEESYYLAKQSADYPTALLDFDGNERASIHLRDSDLNLLHILLQQLARKGLDPATRRSATDALFATINRRRAEWTGEAAQLKEELGALQRQIEKLEPIVQALPKKWSEEDRNTGRDKEAARVAVRLEMLKEDVRAYGEYLRTLDRLLALRREAFDPLRLKIEDLIPRRSMGWPNTIHQLQNYVVGLAPGGLALAPDGSLDMARSFIRLNYFSLLRGVKVRNNVQPGIDSHPVDFVAVRVPRESLVAALDRETMPDEDAIWLYGGDDRQALILARRDAAGQLWLRYLPVAQLKQDASGQVTFNRSEWRADLPLKLWEAQQLKTDGDRRGWLDGWHTELEWLRATHLTEYSNAIIGLHEQLARHEIGALALDQPGLSADERLLRRFRWRQRRLVEADLLILANNHWNFDVRGFNPGGNHGSFFRVSTHSTLLFAGGSATGIPRGRTVEEPYDSLSFIPTVLKLIGQLPDGKPSPELLERGFQPFPGRVIEELFDSPAAGDPVSDAGAAKSPQ